LRALSLDDKGRMLFEKRAAETRQPHNQTRMPRFLAFSHWSHFSHDAGDVIDRGAAADWGGAVCTSHDKDGSAIGANAMRSVLALGLLMTLCAAANAATVHHSKPRHLVRPNQGLTFGHAVSGWAYAPPRQPVQFHDTPSYNDPSKFGGQSLGMDP
jgi:hypothetical protein